MKTRITFHELREWPGKPTPSRRASNFKAQYVDTLNLLDREIGMLGAREADIMADVELRHIRQDGWLKSDAKLRGPGVILTFKSRHGQLTYPCDTYLHWQDNIRAIALALENLRAVDRYGVTKRGEQYTGWAQLPAPADANSVNHMTIEHAVKWLADKAGMSSPLSASSLEVAYRAAAKRLHPDVAGGDTGEFQKLQSIMELIHKHFAEHPQK